MRTQQGFRSISPWSRKASRSCSPVGRPYRTLLNHLKNLAVFIDHPTRRPRGSLRIQSNAADSNVDSRRDTWAYFAKRPCETRPHLLKGLT